MPRNLACLPARGGVQDNWNKLQAIIYVTASQVLCGVAKDLTKLGGKTVTKLVTPDEKQASEEEGGPPPRRCAGAQHLASDFCHATATDASCAAAGGARTHAPRTHSVRPTGPAALTLQTTLFKLVSFITGFKNSLKGAGYFLGAATVGVRSAHAHLTAAARPPWTQLRPAGSAAAGEAHAHPVSPGSTGSGAR